MKRYTPLFLALGSGLLLFAAWPVSFLTFLIFIAWVPLLWMETLVKSRKKFFWLTYLTMFTWNLSTTWWIWNASEPGALAAFFANSFIMCLPWIGYSVARKWLGNPAGYLSLIAFWMCFEFIHLQDWGLSWPWLTLGNAFATCPDWVQWYEFTGTSGGTLWVLISNVLIFSIIREYNRQGRSKKYFVQLAGWILLMFLPMILYKPRQTMITGDQGNNIVVVQPNIDPYEKISAGSFEAQLERLIRLSEKAINEQTVLVIWPETALYMENRINEAEMKQNFFLDPLWAFLSRHPRVQLFTGIESYRVFDHKTPQSESFNGFFYESYNGSALLDSSGPVSFYHKSMLVPGVETLPWFLKFISKWFEKFGGTTAGYAKQSERTVLQGAHDIRIAPAICYESVYGEYMSRFIRNGANLICIITNDGWWKNTPGHKQHMNYARLRAIESRTWVARSANTGISCFIDPWGRVYNPQPYNTEAVIRFSPRLEARTTFFVKYGDILSRVMTAISGIFIIWILAMKFTRWRRNRSEEK